MTPADGDALRCRVRELHDDAVRHVAEAMPVINLGLLRLVADCATPLAALDDVVEGETPFRGDRAIVSDDGETIRLVVCSVVQRDPLAVVELPPITAIRLASDLSAAAAQHLARGGR